MFSYPEIYSKLNFEVATIVFFKKNGDIRVMLGTRNLETLRRYYGFLGKELGGHDNRCNINNGNIALIDAELGQCRSFSIDRLIQIQYHGVIDTEEEMNTVVEQFTSFKKQYLEAIQNKSSLDLMDLG